MIRKLLRLGAISACEGLHIKNCIKTGWFFHIWGIISRFMYPCGNRKFTGLMADGTVLFLGNTAQNKGVLYR